MKRIYLDHAAATPLYPAVKEAMEPYWSGVYGNPSAIHAEGVAARRAVDEARTQIAHALSVHDNEIVFVSGATESANLALFGTVAAWKTAHPNRQPHLIISAIEHAAVWEVARSLERDGARLSILPVDEEGIVVLETLRSLITEDTVLVSVMYVNNEIGSIQPIAPIAKCIRGWKRDTRHVSRDVRPEGDDRYPLFHADAAQAIAYLPIDMQKLGLDLLTFSGSKIGGPKGVGVLASLRHVALLPLLVGGGHEEGRRAGTEPTPLIVGMATAVVRATKTREEESARLAVLRDDLLSRLSAQMPGAIINGSQTKRLPSNVSVTFPGVDHEYLVLLLDAQGIAVSTKSACNEWESETSHVIAALRHAQESSAPASALRISFGHTTTAEDIDTFLVVLAKVLPLARAT